MSNLAHPTALTPEERRDLIRAGLDDIKPLIVASYEARDWEHFGYGSWGDYVAAEFGQLRLPKAERTVAVIEMREAGMSTRAIGDAVGATAITVRRDLAGGTNVPGETITGLDGKTYPARRNLEPLMSSETDQWITPRHIIDLVIETLGVIDLDPCADDTKLVPAKQHYTEQDDGLTKQWFGKVFMNPPYGSGIERWTRKFVTEYKTGLVTEAIALVPGRIDTGWFADFDRYPFCQIRGRLHFNDGATGAPFPSVAVYLGDNQDRFVEVFAEKGPTRPAVYP